MNPSEKERRTFITPTGHMSIDYVQLLHDLEEKVPTEGDQRHNLTIHPETGEPEVTVFSDGWQTFRLEEGDTDPEAVAEEIAEHVLD